MFKKILVLTFIFAFVVRLWGIYPGFPNYHPDESQIYSRGLLILQGREVELGYWGYPALVPLINALFYAIFFIPITFVFKIIQNPEILQDFSGTSFFFQQYIFGQKEINVLYWGRIINALLGGLTVCVVYIVGKKYFNKYVGLFSAIFLSFNARNVLGSHFALPDVANGLFLLLPILFSIKILKNNKTKNYFWSGLTAGLSMSVKLSPFGLVPPFIAHVLSPKKFLTKEMFLKIFLVVLVFIITVLAVNIFHLFHLSDLSHDIDKLNNRYLVGSNKLLIYPYSYLFVDGVGPLVLLLSVFGIVVGIFKSTKRTLILLSPLFLTFFTLTFYSIGGVYVRNFISITPIIILFAGFALWWLTKNNIRLSVFVIIFIFTTQIRNVLNINISYTRPWNINLVRDHFKGNYAGSVVSATPWFSSYINNQDIKFVNWNYSTVFNLSELQNENVDYVLVDTDVFEPMTTWWMTTRGVNAFTKTPKGLLYSTFPISSAKELLLYSTKDFKKPVGVPETNFFVVKIPNLKANFIGKEILNEKFDNRVSWNLKGSGGKIIPNIGQVFEQVCGGCIRISQITEKESTDKYLISSGLPRTFSTTSSTIQLEDNYEYKISADIWNNQRISKDERDGFLKIELFKNKNDADKGFAGELIFVSERYYSEEMLKKRIEKFFYVPEGYKYATFSFQVDRNRNGNFYFDNLVIEQSTEKEIKNLNPLKFPEGLFFVNSLL